MNRLLLLFVLLAAWAGPARAADIPPRPKPFTFVNDQANMLNANDAKKLENGLRKYADTYGTQVVLVTVPSLGGTSAADYARQLGTNWGVGQRDKNNGIVVLLSGKERQMSIEAGSGLRSVITPELTRRVITQQMTPAFKQGNYFAGLSKGLGTIMLAANPSSNPDKTQAATTPTAAGAAAPSASNGLSDNATSTSAIDPVATPEPASSGLGMGTILIGVLIIGGGIWLVSKLFRRNSSASQAGQAPDFMGNRPNNPTPNFGAPNGGYPQGGGNYGGGYGGQAPGSGSGMGGILATGAAPAAGAYLGNRMAGSHDSDTGNSNNFNTGTAAGLGGSATPPANAGSDYFASRNGGTEETSPDYFSGNNDLDSSDSFFSNDSAYDDNTSGDTGGGGFDSTNDNDNSGSW